MHFGDSIFIFLLALVLFGPKKLPEIGRQIGKLLAEFRRASNDFKIQIDEELHAMEQQERQKQLEQAAQQAAAPAPAQPVAELPAETASTEPAATGPIIQPPSTGETVSSSNGSWPYNKDLPVAEIDHKYQEAEAKEEAAHTAASETPMTPSESEQAPIHHG